MPQYIAGPADLQIARGKAVARPKLRKLAQRFKPLLSKGAHGIGAGNKHIGIGPDFAPAHAATELIHLGKT